MRDITRVEYIKIEVEFNYEFEFPDLVQSTVALFNVKDPLRQGSRDIWISKDIQKGSNVEEPRWFRVANALSTYNGSSSPTPTNSNTITAAFSNDGDILFYGTTGGRLYRIDNLNDIDISQIGTSAPNDFVVNNITEHRQVANFGNRAVTGLSLIHI